jgi:hypothetical protein
VTGRPPDFNGAVGTFRIQASAEPTTLVAEDPLLLTVTVTGAASKEHPPQRPRLRSLETLTQFFHVEDLPDRDSRPDAHTWKFVYRLRPRTVRGNRIPRLKFVYYKPGTGYQLSLSSSIPLTVKPRTRVSEDPAMAEGDPRFAPQLPLATGPAVLRREEPAEFPAPLVLAVLFAAPPILCLAWYQLWQRCYPDAMQVADRRRNRAARLALKSLRALDQTQPAGELGGRIAAVVTDYLRQRLDLSAAELTPLEAAGFLERAGVASILAGQVAALVRACDAARFTPEPLAGQDNLAGRATELIRRLEAEPCLSRAS